MAKSVDQPSGAFFRICTIADAERYARGVQYRILAGKTFKKRRRRAAMKNQGTSVAWDGGGGLEP